MSADRIIAYTRDAGCVLVGLGGIVYQIVTGETNAQLLTVCMGLLGFAGAVNIRQLRPRSTNGGAGRSSPAPSSGSPSRPSSPDGGDE